MQAVPKWVVSDGEGSCCNPFCNLAVLRAGCHHPLMARLTVRNLDEATMRELRLRAAENGRTVADEAHEILKAELSGVLENDGQPSRKPQQNTLMLPGNKRGSR